MKSVKAFLILENGIYFEGKSFGYIPGDDGINGISALKQDNSSLIGEIVFNTSMTGYIETLTDPGNFGKMVIQTFPLIGNYGIIPEDFENSRPQLKAYIVREWCQEPSNFRQEGSLDTFLKEHKVPGVYDIDTRALTKIVREYGAMNAKIAYKTPNIPEITEEIKNYKILNEVESVTCSEQKFYKSNEGKYKVVLWDFGAKQSIKKELLKRGCDIVAVPSFTKAEDILKLNPDGILLSNGPGDPLKNKNIITELKKLCEYKIPIFGICLGHLLLALSQGASTKKLKYGHRGNQPSLDVKTGKTYITTQNYGYAVENDSIPRHAEISYLNANDNTCEGIIYNNIPAFSVQFHPEGSPGPLDTGFLFDRFIELMDGGKK